MDHAEFDALVNLIQAHVAFGRATEGRQYDRPHMDARRKELDHKIEEARRVLVDEVIGRDKRLSPEGDE